MANADPITAGFAPAFSPVHFFHKGNAIPLESRTPSWRPRGFLSLVRGLAPRERGMSRSTHKLTVAAVQHAKPAAKRYRMADGHGLTLNVEPWGSKLWWFRFRFAGKEQTLALGSYPEV